MTDYSPRTVELYDGENPDGPDHDYYRSLASVPGTRRVLDLGCGTGILTVTLAAPGRSVVGVDPSPAMIAYARRRSGADGVTWIEGDSRDVVAGPFDLILMTGNVAQHIPDPDWARTLGDLRRLISPGGVLAFESRNPSARAWEVWATEEPTARDTVLGPITEWCEVDELTDGQVVLRSFTRFESNDHVVQEDQLLTFRSAELLAEQLATAGFEISAIWGNWERTPFDRQRVMVVEARAAGVGDEDLHDPSWEAAKDHAVPGDVARLLATVPEWFGQPESNAEYIEAARTKETWTVRDRDGVVVGVTLVDRHFPTTAEIHLTVVDRAAHGSGVGTAMLAAIEADAITRGVHLLEVKTLGPSHPDAGYALTRQFYEKRGFLPVEETALWGEGTPCLIMVKPVGPGAAATGHTLGLRSGSMLSLRERR